jgi:hypothetical protein
MKLLPPTGLVVFALIAAGCATPKDRTANRPHTDSSPAITESNQECDPNYSGCVPIASDVDCVGGNGDGPKYVKGPVRVIGRDVYRLDGDRDGVACE